MKYEAAGRTKRALIHVIIGLNRGGKAGVVLFVAFIVSPLERTAIVCMAEVMPITPMRNSSATVFFFNRRNLIPKRGERIAT